MKIDPLSVSVHFDSFFYESYENYVTKIDLFLGEIRFLLLYKFIAGEYLETHGEIIADIRELFNK